MNRRLPRLLVTVPMVAALASCSASAKDTALTSEEPSLPTTLAQPGPSATDLKTDSVPGAIAAEGDTFSVAPPKGWKDQTDKQAKTVLFLKDPKPIDRIFRSFSVIETSLKDRIPLNDLVEQGMIGQRQQGATATKVADRRIGGVPAAGYRLTRTAEGEEGSVQIVQTQYYVVRDRSVFITTLTAAESDGGKATEVQDEILNSWAWGPPSPDSATSTTEPAPSSTPSTPGSPSAPEKDE